MALTAEAKARKALAEARSERNHDAYVSRTYQLERGEYARLLAAQDGRCAICMRKARNRRLAVDHSHVTGEVRGLLCYTCNHEILGKVETNPIALHNLIVYIANIIESEFGEGYSPLSDSLVEPDKSPPTKLRLPDLPRGDLPF